MSLNLWLIMFNIIFAWFFNVGNTSSKLKQSAHTQFHHHWSNKTPNSNQTRRASTPRSFLAVIRPNTGTNDRENCLVNEAIHRTKHSLTSYTRLFSHFISSLFAFSLPILPVTPNLPSIAVNVTQRKTIKCCQP